MAVMVSPDTITGSVQPMVLMIGLSAMRTGYFISSRPSPIPLARAVITYWRRSSSSRLPRITRTISAVPAVPITSSGIGRCASRSSTLPMLHGANW